MNLFTRLLPPSVRAVFGPPPAGMEQLRRLANILQVDAGELASLRLGRRYHYRPFTIDKRDGRERSLLAPSPALKALQRRLLDDYLAPMPVHPAATAFRRGSSIVENARRHARQSWIATVDLRDFFESTRASRVRGFFARQGWRDESLHLLMRLCLFRGGLPQGAPTSPCLSNLVNGPLDDKLCRLAERAGAIYTRYGDDLTFSWNSDRAPDGFKHAVEDRLHGAGYEVQQCKGWRVSHISRRPTVTGLVLTGNGRVRAPWAWRAQMWRLRWRLWWHGDDDARARLAGYRGLMRMVK